MKIIHITPSYKPAYIYGGPVISVAKLCEKLASQPLDIEVLTTRANGKTELKTPDTTAIDGVKIQYFNRITKDHTHFSPSLLWNLYKMIIKTTPGTVIHIHSWWNFVAIFSCLLAKIKKIPVVLSPRGMLTEYTLKNNNSLSKRLIHQLIGKYLVAYSALHATTEMEKEDILKIIQPKSIKVIPNFIYFPDEDIKKNVHPNYESDKSFKLLFLSRVDEKKGLELLFRALADCQFPWSLTIAGTGDHTYQDKLKQLTMNLDISQSINWIGYIKKEKKYEVLASHQLLVLCSHNENFANIVLESLSVGTAVAISDKVGLAPFIKEQKLGWVADLDPHSITAMLTNAYQSPQIITHIRNNAPSVISSHFNEATILRQYLKLYKNLN
ncbi:XrtY-associated glycosyltransferase XYAG1 [Pedobacter psychroterrae]|uniref:Glycosyltransferase n=1 Tax=Pedobacter psychroterrae TaxID=2530453 RepID=A0A4R0NKU3_9SPHI|nr:glycosyltransferase [Pedobacter psychroterrae]TCD00799.1 glycosyltransferase [Pedobacter psychroterrae]